MKRLVEGSAHNVAILALIWGVGTAALMALPVFHKSNLAHAAKNPCNPCNPCAAKK